MEGNTLRSQNRSSERKLGQRLSFRRPGIFETGLFFSVLTPSATKLCSVSKRTGWVR